MSHFIIFIINLKTNITMETKKLFIALGLAFICIQIGAQVKVLSNG